MRNCEECYLCCYETAVEGVGWSKPAHELCRYISKNNTNKCSIHSSSLRPKFCCEYQCSWLYGFGETNDRPDKTGLIVSISMFNGTMWVFARELEEQALIKKGKRLVKEVATEIDFPVIVVDFSHELPTNFGNRVIVKKELLPRAKKLAGKLLGYLDIEEKFGIYELINRHVKKNIL